MLDAGTGLGLVYGKRLDHGRELCPVISERTFAAAEVRSFFAVTKRNAIYNFSCMVLRKKLTENGGKRACMTRFGKKLAYVADFLYAST